jgi:hypothetical protein
MIIKLRVMRFSLFLKFFKRNLIVRFRRIFINLTQELNETATILFQNFLSILNYKLTSFNGKYEG